MGLQFSRIWERIFSKREMRILMVGLDAAGKVSIKPIICIILLHYFAIILFFLFLQFNFINFIYFFLDHYPLQIKAW